MVAQLQIGPLCQCQDLPWPPCATGYVLQGWVLQVRAGPWLSSPASVTHGLAQVDFHELASNIALSVPFSGGSLSCCLGTSFPDPLQNRMSVSAWVGELYSQGDI